MREMKERFFLILSFFISWGIELVLILSGHVNDGFFNVLSPLISFGPALAVLITKYAIKEPLGMNLWLKPEGRKTAKYVAIGWFGPLALIAVGVLFYFVLFHHQFDGSMQAMVADLRKEAEGAKALTDAQIRQTLHINIVLNVFMAPFYNMFVCIPEEFAWRGYLLNAFCERYPRWKAVLINGLVWGVWYIPMMAMNLFYGDAYKGNMVLGVVYLVVYTMIYCTIFNAIYAFLTIKCHSCIPAMLASACVASMGGVGSLLLKDPDKVGMFINPTNTSIVGGIGFLIAAAVIFYFMYKDKIEPAPMKAEVAAYNDAVARKKHTKGSGLR